MTDPTAAGDAASHTDSRLAEILDQYLLDREHGRYVDPDLLVAKHPELADPLKECLGGMALLDGDIAEFHQADTLPHLDLDSAEVGRRRLGAYELIREIGRGGMGIVYEALDTELDRRVALKVLPPASLLSSQQKLRFQNEARAAAQVQHPHIVPVHGIGAEGGLHYYTMPIVEGTSVRRVIDRLRRESGDPRPKRLSVEDDAAEDDAQNDITIEQLDLESVVGRFPRGRSVTAPQHLFAVAQLGLQTARALHAVHERGVIHRDIKPSNLLLDGQGDVWITDFGLARCQSHENHTRTGDVVGTLHYMSPEQGNGQNTMIDRRTDIYGLGVTLYELLALHRPFEDQPPPWALPLENCHRGKSLRQWNQNVPKD